MASRTFEVVVAHYNEDLTWLKSVADECVIYSKGVAPSLGCRSKYCMLPNIGREGHTYLHHIVTHFHELADVTLFVQGHIADHVAWSIGEMKDACLNMDGIGILTFPSTDLVSTELVRFDEWTGIRWELHPCLDKWKKMDMKLAEMTPAAYFAHFFGNGKVPLCVGYNSGAVFAVQRQLIQNLTLDFYQDLQEKMFLGLMEHVNPETGFLMERFWLAMWQPDEYVCWGEVEVSKTERNSRGQLAKGRWRPLPINQSENPDVMS